MKKFWYTLMGIGVVCLLYYLACGIFSGFNVANLWFWVVIGAGIFSLGFCGLRWGKRIFRRRCVRIITITAAVTVLCVFITVECLIISKMNAETPTGLDYVLVLGAKVNGTVPSYALEYRIRKAEEYLKDNPNTICVATGGKQEGDPISEAECIRNELVKAGIDPERIILEDRSTSTAENIQYTYEIIPDECNTGLITNNFHIFRATKIAEKNGAHSIYGISAEYVSVLFPHYMLREFFALTVDWMKGNI